MNFLIRLLLPIFLPECRRSWVAFARSCVTVLIIAFAVEGRAQPQDPVVVKTDGLMRDGIFITWAGITTMLAGTTALAAGAALYVRYVVNVSMERAINNLERWIDDKYVRRDVLNSKMERFSSQLAQIEKQLDSHR